MGAITPQVSPGSEYGLGVDLQSVQPQLTQIFSSPSSIAGSHTVTVPAFNKWVLPASVGLSLSLSVNGQVVYQTSKASVSLAPFRSGTIDLTVQIPSSVLAQMQGQQITGGGQMTLGEAGLWSISVSIGGVS